MITFNVVREKHGWSVRMGQCMKTTFWTRDHAVQEANCLADAIRCHGECAEVIVEGDDPKDPHQMIKSSSSPVQHALWWGRWAGSQ